MNEEQASDEFLELGEAVFEQLGAVSHVEDAAVLEAMVEKGMSAGILGSLPSILGAVAIVAGLAGGALWLKSRSSPEVPAVTMDARSDSTEEAPDNPLEGTVRVAPRAAPESPHPELMASTVAAPQTPTVEEPPPAANKTKTTGLSAAELLVSANKASRAGKRAKARRLYAELASEHPESRERQVARVGLGDLELKAGRAKRALSEYSAYLEANPKGNLAEDALAGKARSMEDLGREAEAQVVWGELLDRFPGSVHAARARKHTLEQTG